MNRRLLPLALVAALMAVAVVYVAYLTARHLNYIQIDLAGHIASAASLRDGFYHQFNDRFFLGYVHGMFYPPLEDLLLCAFAIPFGGDLVRGYHLYLPLLFAVYLLSLFVTSQVFSRTLARVLFLLLGLAFIFTYKPSDGFQGLGAWDLLVTGLSAQILGAIFLFSMVRELDLGARPAYVAIFATLTISSHLIMGLVAGLYLGAHVLTRRRFDLFWAGVATLGLTAYFWMPFVAHRSSLFQALIHHPHRPWIRFAAASATVLLVAALWVKRAIPAAIVACICLGSVALVPTFEKLGYPLPPFHYYRLASPGLFALLLACAQLLDAARRPSRVALALMPLALVATFMYLDMSPFSPALDAVTWQPTQVDDSHFQPTTPTYGRHWLLQNPRACDFGLDSLLSLRSPDFRSNKGLYWETQYTNGLLTSFLVTLSGMPAVLDYFYFFGDACPVNDCMFASFLRTYNIQSFSVDPAVMPTPIPHQVKPCYQRMLSDKSVHRLALIPDGGVTQNNTRYATYRIEAAASGAPFLGAVEPISQTQLRIFALPRRELQRVVMQTLHGSCLAERVADDVFIPTASHDALTTAIGTPPPDAKPDQVATSLKRTGIGEFELTVDAPESVLFWIKLSYFPGFELRTSDGRALPLVEALPGMIGYGRGKMTLRYRPPRVFAVSAVLSILTCVAGLWWLRRRRVFVSASPSP